jgi:hypothetical protein
MINEKTYFEFNGKNTNMTMLDFWKFQYSSIYDIQGSIAEFIVAKALECENPYNREYWTLFDVLYRNIRIEVKESSYYHAWNKDDKVSMSRNFGITKANSQYEQPNKENKYERQNDIYVFCLNTGFTKNDAYPLNLNNWEFYIIPTSIINEKCKDNKTISLVKIKKLGYAPIPYDKIKEEIDNIIDNNLQVKSQ